MHLDNWSIVWRLSIIDNYGITRWWYKNEVVELMYKLCIFCNSICNSKTHTSWTAMEYRILKKDKKNNFIFFNSNSVYLKFLPATYCLVRLMLNLIITRDKILRKLMKNWWEFILRITYWLNFYISYYFIFHSHCVFNSPHSCLDN